jgi:hypothetical protein
MFMNLAFKMIIKQIKQLLMEKGWRIKGGNKQI